VIDQSLLWVLSKGLPQKTRQAQQKDENCSSPASMLRPHHSQADGAVYNRRLLLRWALCMSSAGTVATHHALVSVY
jgi:hypothetical protein